MCLEHRNSKWRGTAWRLWVEEGHIKNHPAWESKGDSERGLGNPISYNSSSFSIYYFT